MLPYLYISSEYGIIDPSKFVFCPQTILTTVDSIPKSLVLPSIILTYWSKKSLNTCTELVGLTWLNRFALGAAIGHPEYEIIYWDTGWFGARIPTKSVPAVIV